MMSSSVVGKNLKSRIPVGVLVICYLCMAGKTASADDDPWKGVAEAVLAGIIIWEISISVGGLVVTPMNIYYIAKEEKSTNANIGGFIIGGFNVLTGVIWLRVGEEPNDNQLAIGISHIAFGTINMVLGLWAYIQADQIEQQKQGFSVGPIIIPDSRGNAAFGVGLRLVDW